MAQIPSYVAAQSNANYTNLVNAGEGSMSLGAYDDLVDWGSLLITKDNFLDLPDNTTINWVRIYYSARVNGSSRKAGIRIGAGWISSYTINDDKTYTRGTYNPIVDVFKGTEITSTSYVEKYETLSGITLEHLKHGLRLPFGAYENNSILSCTLYVQNIRLIVDYTLPEWEYKVLSEPEKTCYITKYNGTSKNVSIPQTIDGYTVVRLGYKFHGSTSDTKDFDENENIYYTTDSSITGSNYYGPFSGKSNLETVNIPSSVRWIGYQAFRNCTSLTSISWTPTNSCVIGRTCFYNCSSLANFNVPDNIIEVYGYSFQNCSSLTRLNFKNKNIKFKNSIESDSIPTTTFSGTSDSLVIGLYHETDNKYSNTFTEKIKYYYDAIVNYISDNQIIKTDYIEIDKNPNPPIIEKSGYILIGWSDGTNSYELNNLPVIKSNSNGAIDVSYTALWQQKFYFDSNSIPKIILDNISIKKILIDQKRIY